MYYAHTAETPTGKQLGQEHWQLLSEHLQNVANKAQEFGEPLGLATHARLTGILHDLGKYRDFFQEYLAGKRPRSTETHHAVYGAALAFEKKWLGPAFAIAGHHAGLHNLSDLQNLVSSEPYDAMNRLAPLIRQFEAELEKIPDKLNEPEFDDLAHEFYVRMLFSCLIDADFLNTERFRTGQCRSSVKLDAALLLKRLQTHCNSLPSSGELNRLRNKVFKDCLRQATATPGFFSLTVPTGGGKTFSSMAFALEHARQHQMQRIIVVIPYLSIIEQNASTYRTVLDPQNEGIVVEDHSSVVTTSSNEEQSRTSAELATENWDAPLIVTTAVQFIESLFASRPSKCRKLHNIANSVVLLDEVQTLPSHLLDPLLHILRDLKEHYQTSFIFSTATQPAFVRSASLRNGFTMDEMTEIVCQPNELFHKLERIRYEMRPEKIDWQELAQELEDEPQVLGIVNTRHQAAKWWSELRNKGMEGVFHLSSAMCAEHRTQVLETVKRRLENDETCRLISTQVVEAGVDIDFPLVYRALGPLDSIVQAAGRCNREGHLADKGRVIVFQPMDAKLPGGVYRVATGIAARLLQQSTMDDLWRGPELFKDYFKELFQYVPTDECSIQEDRQWLRFRDVAHKAKVIPDDTQAIIVPTREALGLVAAIRGRFEEKAQDFIYRDWRQLQRFTVNLRRYDFQKLDTMGFLDPLLPGMALQILDRAAYHEYLGVTIEERPIEDFLI